MTDSRRALRPRLSLILILALSAGIAFTAQAQGQLGTPEQLAEAFKRFPDADTNRDAVTRFSGVYSFSLLYGVATADDPPIYVSSALPDLSLINAN